MLSYLCNGAAIRSLCLCLSLAAPYCGAMADRQMNIKQQRFVAAYLISGSAEKAAIEAGYSPKSARTVGPLILRNTAVAAYLAAQQAKLMVKAVNRKDRILQELEKIAFLDLNNLVTTDEDGDIRLDYEAATPEQIAAMRSIGNKTRRIYNNKGEHIATEKQTKVEFHDKMRGLELLGKAEGMFANDKVEVVVDVADRLLAARNRVLRLSNGSGSEDVEAE